MSYLVPFVFFFLSFVFSMLGMGGAQIYIPILYWLGMDFKYQAIPLGLLLNFFVQISATTTYIKHKLVDFKIAVPFAIGVFLFTPLGTMLNFKLKPEPIIILFSVFTFLAGVLALLGYKPKNENILNRRRKIIGFFSGSLLGFLVGLIGRGGGSFIVPILLLMGIDPRICVGTSSFIAVFSSLTGFISHLFKARFNTLLVILTVVSVILGSQFGSRFMAKKLKSKILKKIFGFVLILISILLIRSVLKK